MDYTELNFFLFCALAITGHLFFLKNKQHQIYWLIISSFFFLLSWSWQSGLFVIVNSLMVFGLAIYLESESPLIPKKMIATFGIFLQILVLFLIRAYSPVDNSTYEKTVLISSLLIGVSYYCMQNIAYIVEIYRKNLKAEIQYSNFLLYSIYFPKALLGPIERYDHFIGELNKAGKPRNLTYSFYLIAFGLFKRLVISSRILKFYFEVEASYSTHKPILIFWTAGFMTFMIIYCDFSAYMNIGRGVSLMFGIDLTENFNQPYLARTPLDYWQRWHISLGHWMRSYVYYPILLLTKKVYVAIFFTFVAVGLWHGFKKELFIWAFSWGVFQISYLYMKRHCTFLNSIPVKIREFIGIVVTFNLSAMIGLFSLVLLFFKKELPDAKVLYDEQSLTFYKDNLILIFCLFLMMLIESLEKRNSSKRFYYCVTLLLGFLIASLMSNKSYLFYYMRI